MRWAIAIVGVVMFGVSATGSAQDAENAADHYRKAFAALPDTSDPQWAFLNQPEAVRLDANTADFVKRHDATFAHLRAAVVIQRCDWWAPGRGGVEVTPPGPSSFRTIANLARLRARVLFQQRRHAEAFEDAAALLAMARNHLAIDPAPWAKWVEVNVADAAVAAASRGIADAPPEAARRFHDALGQLPRPIPLGDVMKVHGEALVLHLRDIGDDETLFKKGGEFWLATGGEKADEKLREGLHGQWKDPARREAGIREVAALYEEGSRHLNLPFQISFAVMQKWDAKRQAASPLARAMVPSLRDLRIAAAASDTRLEMLFVAAAIRAEGPKAVGEFHEPHAQGPFEYREIPGGFELESKLVVNNQPLKLVCRASDDALPF